MEQIIKFPAINLDGIKGVLLDLDNTLYDYETCHAKAIKKCHSVYRAQIDAHISFNAFCDAYREKRDIVTKRLSPQGACRSRLFAFQAMFEELNLRENWQLAYQYEELYWDTLIDSMVLAKDAARFLTACKKSKIDICIVSDMTARVQIRKLQKLALAPYIKYLVTSEEVGAEKPSRKIFATALAKLKLQSDEVIMVGDSESKDIKGAEALGIKSYRVLTEP